MYVLGIDAGGTKTHCLICDKLGNICGFGASGPGNYEVKGLAAAKKEILKAINQAKNQAKISTEQIKFACFGLAGADRKEDFLMLDKFIKSWKMFRNFVITNDSFVALRGGTKKTYGVVIVSGTGTVSYGINKKGKEARTTGLSYAFGEWGSGNDIAEEALKSVIRSYELREDKTMLSREILKKLGLKNVEELIDIMYKNKINKEDLTEITKLIFEIAERKDNVAKKILIKAGVELSSGGISVIRRLKMQNDNFDVVLAGSVFKGKGNLLINVIKREIKKVAPKANVTLPLFSPVVGAVIVALEKVGRLDEEIYKKFSLTTQIQNH